MVEHTSKVENMDFGGVQMVTGLLEMILRKDRILDLFTSKIMFCTHHTKYLNGLGELVRTRDGLMQEYYLILKVLLVQ